MLIFILGISLISIQRMGLALLGRSQFLQQYEYVCISFLIAINLGEPILCINKKQKQKKSNEALTRCKNNMSSATFSH